MQKKTLILIVLICLSCEGLFHENDIDYLVVNEREEMIDMLNGIYSNLVKVFDYEYFSILARSDDINVYTSYSYYSSDGSHSCSGGEGEIDFQRITGEIYTNLYLAIVTANHLILQLSDAEVPEITGEVYFLRAYCYFKLARLFGTPPLIDDIDVDYLVEKPTYREVYEFIESDMLKALELLPNSYSDARIPGETPNKGTAKAMLAEIYLAMAGFPVNDDNKYAEAARLTDEVIDQADQYHYALLDDFANLWKVTYRHNTENIFGLFFNEDGEGTQNTIGNIRIDSYFSDNELEIDGGYHPEFKFYNTFPDNYRKYTSFVTGLYNHNSFVDTNDNYITGLIFEPIDPLVDPCDFVHHVVSLKWIDPDAYRREDAQWINRSDITLYLLRYAQTLLTYAEAKARSGNLDASCYEAVNMIRRRANRLDIHTPSEFDLPPDLTTGQFLDSVVWERAWELCTEPEGRWFDIIRLDLKDELANYRYSRDVHVSANPLHVNEDWYFFLVPKQDRWLNPNFRTIE